ncbi:MAG TPA: hypothetical protein PKX87_06420 [Alphaproteobacteria bacterium]|nr:hypothetical protein [Alphaproteobacteria bacterium]
MGLRRAFAGAAIGGFLGSLTNTPALGSVGFTAGLLSGGHGGGGFANREVRDAWTTSRFEANHPIAAARWDARHTSPAEAALAAVNPARAARLEAMDFNRTLGGPVSPYYPPGMRYGGPSLAGGLYPAAGIAATGGAALGNIFNSMASGITSIFGGGAPAPQMQLQDPSLASLTSRGPGFTPSGFNSV